MISVEATKGALLACVLRALGHQVRLVALEFVKPYLKRRRTNDAEANCEAVNRPSGGLCQATPSSSKTCKLCTGYEAV